MILQYIYILMLQISQVQERWSALDCDVRLEVKSVYKHSAHKAEPDSADRESKEAPKQAPAQKSESTDYEEKDNKLLRKKEETGEDQRLREGVSHATEDADELCPAKRCGDIKDHMLQWDCFADSIFGPPPAHGRYVAQNCRNLGFGNAMTCLQICAEIAAQIGARVIFERDIHHLWELPYQYDTSSLPESVFYDYSGEKYVSWRQKINTTEGLRSLNHRKLMMGACHTDPQSLVDGRCTTSAIPAFAKCFEKWLGKGHTEIKAGFPGYYATFRKPTAQLRRHLEIIRGRLGLPLLPPGLEPSPGRWGLYTPGYFMLALQWRGIPVGFEAHSLENNQGDQITNRHGELSWFWRKAEETAARAKEIAACRNETLLIYLATDDAENQRGVAVEKLSGYGRVVYGLTEEEVGHPYPGYTDVIYIDR